MPRDAPKPVDPPLLALLMKVSREADAAEKALAEARASYGRAPTPEGLEAVRRRSEEALALELRFDAIWRDAASSLFVQEPKDAAKDARRKDERG